MLQDPTYFRSGGAEKGRDGCRVPLPWTPDGPSLGFGDGPAHLPQPESFAGLSVEHQLADSDSTLRLYQHALRLRRRLQTSETLEWVDDGDPDVLHFRRPNGWQCITNFGIDPIAIPRGLVLSSGPLDEGRLPKDTTVWTA